MNRRVWLSLFFMKKTPSKLHQYWDIQVSMVEVLYETRNIGFFFIISRMGKKKLLYKKAEH